MAFGMVKGGKPSGKKFAQADKSAGKAKTPKTGADDNPKTKQAGNGNDTFPGLPSRDGPAKDKVGGKDAGKPKTSAKAGKGKPDFAGMRSSLKQIGKF